MYASELPACIVALQVSGGNTDTLYKETPTNTVVGLGPK